MKFGVLLPQGFYGELAGFDGSQSWEAIATFARHVEDLGFASIWVADHLLAADGGDADILDAWTLATALSQVTTTVRIGTLVLCAAFRNPALTARMAATLDGMTQGRVILGLGAGWLENEYAAFGYTYGKPVSRIEQLRETVEIIRRLWSGASVTYEGEHWRVQGASCRPLPVQDPMPMLIGGTGRRHTLRLVAEHASIANFPGSSRDFAACVEQLRAHCETVGRDPASITLSWLNHGLLLRETDHQAEAALGELTMASPLRGQHCEYSGTPERFLRKLRRYEELGCELAIVSFADAPSVDSLDLFASEILTAYS